MTYPAAPLGGIYTALRQATVYRASDFHNQNEASFGEFNPITHENLCNLHNLCIKFISLP